MSEALPYAQLAGVWDSFMQETDHTAWSRFLIEAAQKQQPEKFAHILELGCGTGNLTEYFLKSGYEVVGIDASDAMLWIAKEKLASFGDRLILLEQDLTELELEIYQIPCVIAGNDVFNYLVEEDTLRWLLRFLNERMQKGAPLVFDISSYYKISQVLADSVLAYDEENGTCLWQNSFDPKENLLQIDLTLFKKRADGLFEKSIETHWQRAWHSQEIEQMLEEAGFEAICRYDDFSWEVPCEKAQRWIFSCRKA